MNDQRLLLRRSVLTFAVIAAAVFFPRNIWAAFGTEPAASDPSLLVLLVAIASVGLTFAIARGRRTTDGQADWHRLLLDHSADAICLLDETGALVHFSPALSRLTGYPAAELRGMAVKDIDADLDPKEVAEAFAACRPGQVRMLRTRCRHKSRPPFPAEIHLHTIEHNGARHHVAVMRDVTGTVDAEARLRASEARYRTLVDHATDALYLHDEGGTLLDVNRRACEVLGYCREELLNLNVSDVDEDYPKPVAKMLWESLANEEPATIYGHHRRKDGSVFPVEVHLRAFQQDDRRLFLALARDITERKKAEAALALSENRLRTIVESEPECVKLLSPDMTLLEMNPAGLAMVEADHPDEAIGQDVTRLIDEADRKAFININREAFQGRTGVLEFRMTGLKGSRRWLETHVAPLRDQDGEIIAALSITREITDRKRDEALLLRLLQGTAATSGEEFFHALVQSLAESLEVDFAIVGEFATSLSPERRESCTARVKTLSAWRGNRLANNFYYEIAGTPCEETLLKGFRFHGSGIRERFPNIALLHEMKIESYMGAPLRTRDGQVIGILVVLDTKPMPSSHRRETVFNLFAERAGLELSRIQAQRNRRELEEELRHVQRMESVGTLAGGIAHDFNNLLSVVTANTDLALLDLPPDHRVRPAIDEIFKATRRATSLVSQILAFSRRTQPSRNIVRLDEIVAEATRMLRSVIPSAVELVSTVASGVPPVLADSSQLHQVLVNLCTNAWQATGEFAGRIEVKLDQVTITAGTAAGDPELHEGQYARLSVIDDGAGMDADTMRRIFDPFFTTKGPDEGTGLGLAVVHGIVRDHDGKVHVASEPGRGTTFSVLLPTVEDVAPDDYSTDHPMPSGRSQHVLYVDDESALVSVAERVLDRIGYRCTGFTDPAEAVRRFSENPDAFDVVIADFNMPQMTGLYALRQIRAARPDMPVILSSGNFTNQIAAAASADGIHELLYKPHSIKDLQAKLNRVLAPTQTNA